IVLVPITDTTIRDFEPAFGHWPWPRAAFAYAIDFFHRGQARVVAVDLLFVEKDVVAQYDLGGEKLSGEASDLKLAGSVKAAGNVILLSDAINEGVVGGDDTSDRRAWRDAGYRLGPRLGQWAVGCPPLAPPVE